MDDDLIDDARISLRRRTQLPGKGFFYPDSLDEERADERVRETVEGAEAVVIADGDADGLGCVALIRETRDAALDVEPFEAAIEARLAREREREPGRDAGDAAAVETAVEAEIGSSPVAVVRTSPHSMAESFERVAAYADPGVDVYVCDLCPDTVEEIAEPLAALVERAGSIRWFDHHQWDEAVAAAVGEHGVDLVVGASDEECSTGVALRSLDYEFPERFSELAAVTRDHDLWLREDPRSDDIADYAYWAGGEEYVTVVGHYGADLPASVHEFIEARRVEKERRIDVAVERAEFHDVGPWTVAATYGRCSQNEVAERLRVAGADAAVIVKPAGSASIRGSESFERCHDVAGQVNGGGHPKAAGCKPDVYDDMLDYAHHWTTGGRTTKRVILQAFERVAEAVDADAEADSDEGGEDEVTTTDDDAEDVSDAAGDDAEDEGIETDR
jgi:oligoribonuclease NrnB/cAMP/cGMP phosphodiesterase (DHH superfamily)